MVWKHIQNLKIIHKIKNIEQYFISLAIKQAEIAFQKNEVPIGCVIAKDGNIIVQSYNQTEYKNSALGHAELIAISQACKKLNYKHLLNTQIYCTIEPCTMCIGAIANARIAQLFFGAYENKMGYLSIHNKINDKILLLNNHKLKVQGGILSNKCSKLINSFFMDKRKKNN